jgi:valyl-tRNA synthetase
LDELEEKEAPVSIIDDYKLMLKIEIDVEAEQGRLQKEIEKLDNEIKKCEAKLGNSSFIDKAPKQVVDQEKDRLNGFNLSKQKFQAQLEKIS